jgi:hypothetical protein
VLRPSVDTCAFAATPAGDTFVSRVEDSSAALYYGASGTMDATIYRSTDDGATFPISASPGEPGDWWSSLVIARSNPQRVYLTGYRIDSTNHKHLLAFTSTDGGATFTPMPQTGIAPVSQSSALEIVGVDANDERLVYAKLTVEDGELGDSVYRSTDAGQTWTKILTRRSVYGLTFLVRRDGTCVAGTRELGGWRSPDCATAASPTWTALAGAPSIACLVEDPSSTTIWACTQNSTYTPMPPAPPVPGDGFAIMTSADLATWTGLLRLQDIAGPVPCPLGTPQRDLCVEPTMDNDSAWCCFAQLVGITATPVDCTGIYACDGPGGVDGAADAGSKDLDPPERHCCGASDPRSSALLSLLVVLGLRRRRRART